MPEPFVYDPVLTGIALAYQGDRLIADNVLPRIPVLAKRFAWMKWDKDEGFTLPETLVGRTARPREVEFTAQKINDEAYDYGLDDPIPNDDVTQAQNAGIDPFGRATTGLMKFIALDREVRVAGLVFNAANYDAANKTQLVGNQQWTDKLNSDPVADITTGMDAAFIRPNTMTIGRVAYTALVTHPKTVTAVGMADQSAGVVKRRQLLELFELDNIFVGESRINQAKKGQTASYGRIWGNHCLLHYNDPQVQSTEESQPTFGFTAEFGSRVSGTISEPKRGLRGTETVRTGETLKEVIAAADVAYFIEDAAA
ncbi:MAG TPA: capsid protein [Kiloniellaceae bacterium]|nr:capsid protein [Kiloniellaceae bacterium]